MVDKLPSSNDQVKWSRQTFSIFEIVLELWYWNCMRWDVGGSEEKCTKLQRRRGRKAKALHPWGLAMIRPTFCFIFLGRLGWMDRNRFWILCNNKWPLTLSLLHSTLLTACWIYRKWFFFRFFYTCTPKFSSLFIIFICLNYGLAANIFYWHFAHPSLCHQRMVNNDCFRPQWLDTRE